jgi:hypothetical protein
MNPDKDSRTAGRDVPARVAAALVDCDQEYRSAIALPHSTAAEWATRSERVALACARRAGWWHVLERWAYSRDGDVPAAFGRAVVVARLAEQNRARDWRGSARDWRARAENGQGTAGAWAMWDDGVSGVAS